MKNFIVSLTTIPERFGLINDTIFSIFNQSLTPAKIIINIPREYRRFGKINLENIPKIDGIEINLIDFDYGPASKILPLISNYESNQTIIYCDDDVIYPKDWAKNLIITHKKFPDFCICGVGQSVDILRLKYEYSNSNNMFLRLLNQHKYRLNKKIIKSNIRGNIFSDIAAGYGGVLVKPKFFKETVFNIPEHLWTVDDIWLSGNLRLGSINIMHCPEAVKNLTFSKSHDINPLTGFIYNDQDRDLSNYECIEYFNQNYGIWSKN